MSRLGVLIAACASCVLAAASGSTMAVTVTFGGLTGNCALLGQGPIGGGILVTKEMMDLGPCDVQITVSDLPAAGGQTTITFWEAVVNSTPFSWHDFHQTIGYGTGDSFAESGETDFVFFVDNPAPDGENFVLVGQDEPGDPDSLDWKARGRDFPPSPPFVPPVVNLFKLGVVVTDVDANGRPDNDGTMTFTVRQIATIDEPSGLSIMLMVIGAAALGGRPWRGLRPVLRRSARPGA